MNKVIFSGIFCLLTSFVFSQEHKATFINGAKFKGVIFDSLLSKNQSIPPNLQLYNLTKKDIYHAEKILQNFFKIHGNKKYECCIIFPLKHYYRQYYGYHKNEDIIISINFIYRKFIRKNKSLLDTEIIDLDDGGRTRFNMEINLSKGQIIFIDSNARGGRIYEG